MCDIIDKEFENNMKELYHERTTDKISKKFESINKVELDSLDGDSIERKSLE